MCAPDRQMAVTAGTDPSAARLRGRWLWAARAAWTAAFVLSAVIYVLGFLAVREAMSTACEAEPCTLRQQVRQTEAGEEILNWPGPPVGYADRLRPDQAEVLERLGLTLDGYGWLAALQMGLPALVYLLIAAGLFWKKSDDPMVLFASVMVMTFARHDMPLSFTLIVRQPAWRWFDALALMVALSCFLIFPLIFPTGRFVPRWTRWAALLVMAGAIPLAWFEDSALEIPGAENLILVYLFTSFSLGVFAQLYRYFRVAGPLERQQLKWVIVGLAAFVGSTFAVTMPLQTLLTASATSTDPALALVQSAIPDTLFRTASLFIPVSIAISVVRYRLWDIDIIIRRTLVYGLLTGTLALVYFSSVVVLQQLFQPAIGQQAPAAIAVSTLAIAALFNPFRGRIQDFIDRRFYRRKYDAARTLAEFAAAARDETDLDRLTGRLVGVVEETVQPEHVSLWLRRREEPERE